MSNCTHSVKRYGHLPPDIPVGTRVRILTPTSGCYDGKTGTVTEILTGNFEPVTEKNDPRFYRVKLDAPADNGGTSVYSDVFPIEELFPEKCSHGYWHTRQIHI